MDDDVPQAPRKRRALTPAAQQAKALQDMFEDPERAMRLPSPPHSAWKVREPPEMVKNVPGSSAGVSSGEFHVYKQTRRRESDRIQAMQAEADREKAQAIFDAKRDKLAAIDDAKTSKNRARRAKKKRAMARARGTAHDSAADLPVPPDAERPDDAPRASEGSGAPESTSAEAPKHDAPRPAPG